MNRPIPRVVHLPFGYVVHIRQLDKATFKMAYDAAFHDDNVTDTVAFCVPSDQGAEIVLNKNRKWTLKRDDLFHELSHVMVEYGEYIKTITN